MLTARRSAGHLAAFAALAALAVGCGGREFAEVEGTVTLDGAPLPDVEVVFVPDAERGNAGNNASGFTDARGRYRLKAERDRRDGTVLGPHRVLVIDLGAVTDISMMGGAPGGAAAPAPRPAKERRFPSRYADLKETPFKDVDIKSGKQTLDYDLKAAGK